MNILLDTHCFISIAILWEMAIKISLEKLIVKQPFENIIKSKKNLVK